MFRKTRGTPEVWSRLALRPSRWFCYGQDSHAGSLQEPLRIWFLPWWLLPSKLLGSSHLALPFLGCHDYNEECFPLSLFSLPSIGIWGTNTLCIIPQRCKTLSFRSFICSDISKRRLELMTVVRIAQRSRLCLLEWWVTLRRFFIPICKGQKMTILILFFVFTK